MSHQVLIIGLEELLEEENIIPSEERIKELVQKGVSKFENEQNVSISKKIVDELYGRINSAQRTANFAIANFSGLLVFNPDIFEKQDYYNKKITGKELIIDRAGNVKTGFHELGHAVSEFTNEDYGVVKAYSSFYDLLEGAEIEAQSLRQYEADEFYSRLSRRVSTHFKAVLTERALEEARAESFGLEGLSKTKIGKDVLSLLANQKDDQSLVNKFLTAYSYLSDDYKPFQNYTDRLIKRIHSSPLANDIAGRLDIDAMVKESQIAAHTTYMRSINYGEFTDILIPGHNKRIQTAIDSVSKMFNQRQIEQNNIDVSKIIAQYVVEYREPGDTSEDRLVASILTAEDIKSIENRSDVIIRGEGGTLSPEAHAAIKKYTEAKTKANRASLKVVEGGEKMAKRTLDGILESGKVAANVMRNRF